MRSVGRAARAHHKHATAAEGPGADGVRVGPPETRPATPAGRAGRRIGMKALIDSFAPHARPGRLLGVLALTAAAGLAGCSGRPGDRLDG